MNEQLKKVEEFHNAFNVKNAQEPTLLEMPEFELRYSLMVEENMEYLEACHDKSIIEIADALGDQLYILCGTMLRHGLQHKIEEVFDEIHRSNMSKLLDSKPVIREDGKIMKGSNYSPPDLGKILNID